MNIYRYTMRTVLVLLLTLVGPSLQACDPAKCVLPGCRCYNDPETPGNLELADIPQIIMISFDGTINQESIEYYNTLFDSLTNPNGCPARGSFFLTDQGSAYSLVKALYDQGHEIGIQSEDSTSPKSSNEWIDMLKKVKSQLTDIGIKAADIKGVRAPQIVCGGNEELIGIGNQGLLYDSSCSNVGFSNASSLIWPYTFDFVPVASCDNGKAPDLPFKGKWEVVVADLHDLTGQKLPCVVPSGCRNVTTKRDAFDIFFNGFTDRYNGLRTPFNMILDPAWVKNQDLRDGTAEFLQYVSSAFPDVYIVPIAKALDWIQDPTPIANLTDFEPWKCTTSLNLDLPQPIY